MPIEFALRGLHPTYTRTVIDTLRGLDVDYPLNALRRVQLSSWDSDVSLASAGEPGEITLNEYWFGRPVEVLQQAARDRPIIYLAGGECPVPWHGPMEEPHHTLAHEFGHCLSNVVPQWRDFAETHWRAACRDPVACRPVSGYALTGPDEFWADNFAALRLGVDCEVARLMRDLLEEVLR